MDIRISKELALALGKAALKPYSLSKEFDRLTWNEYLELNLDRFSAFKLVQLKNLISPHEKLKGARANIRDITTVAQGMQGNAETVKVNTVQQFVTLLTKYLAKVPGHRVYKKNAGRNVWSAYYVGGTEYHPPEKSRYGNHPAYGTMTMFAESMGRISSERETWYLKEIKSKTVDAILRESGYYPETEELRATYLKDAQRFRENVTLIGKQFYARGEASDDVDGNAEKRDGWWWRATHTLLLDKDGEPSKVVCDKFFEEEKDRNSDRDVRVDHDWWRDHAKVETRKLDDDEDDYDDSVPDKASREDDDVEDAADDDAVHMEEIPVHPFMVVFDLKRHLRLKVHIAQLEDYVYNEAMGDQLVLPTEDRELVDMLLAQAASDQFRDIVAGKGGGHILMCEGVPGTGKTLTAEVYAEVAKRPLYSVQCSQLGTTPTDLEDELLKVLARGARWNAITLLDEADVYVAERGRDLTQNAIVGVFLRVLEYYKGVMFLTTNKAGMVDDAVASRCVARIHYGVPTKENQQRIWRVLADANKIELTDKEIGKIVREFDRLTGRDIKNLLKLAALRGSPVTYESVKFVKRFKPTADATKSEREEEHAT